MERDNPYADAARIEKASILTDLLFSYAKKLDAPVQPTDIDAIAPEVWQALCNEANREAMNNRKGRLIHPPSAETKEAIKAMVARRNMPRAADPFKRFR